MLNKQTLSAYRIAHLTAHCSSDKNFNIKLKHFANGNSTANAGNSYRQAKKSEMKAVVN